ncbi:hypothetical protein Tco_0996681, partial [Tanacetum coccineum]
MTVSPLNDNEIDFRISFDESDDEDYTVIFDKNSFSNKIISVDDLKMDLENDNDKVNMPYFPSPEPMVSYFDDLHYLKDFVNEFLAIVYNDALTSKSNFLTEPTVCPQHVNEFNLHHYMALPPRDQRHQYLRFKGLEYTDADIIDFEERLGRIYDREIYRFRDRVYSLAELGGGYLKIRGPLLGGVKLRKSWREFILGIGLHNAEEIESVGFSAYWAESVRDSMLRLCHRLIACSIAERSQAPEKVIVTDLFYSMGMDVGSINIAYLLA